MKKNGLLWAWLLLFPIIGFSQTFEMTGNPVDSTTDGTAEMDPSLEDPYVDVVLLESHVKNLSADPITLKWQLITDSTAHPEGWLVVGICDNINCRSPYSDFYYGITQTSNPIEPDSASLLEMRVYAPVSAPNGVGTMKVRVSDEERTQSDTVVYILRKNSTGINVITVGDERVGLYPNPARDEITLYVDQGLKAGSAEIYDIIGRKFQTIRLSGSLELTQLPVSRLSNGIYMLRVLDESGRVLTTRRFTKR